jgi:DNA-binding NtrC family response regulator
MPTKRRILIVDDDAAVRLPMRHYLSGRGYDVAEAAGMAAALEAWTTGRADAAVLDFSLPDGDGLTLLRQLKALEPSLPVVLLTGHGTIDLAVQAMKDGAEQFFTKPVEMSALQVVLERALETQRMRQVSLVGQTERARQSVDPFLGESPAIRQLKERAHRLVASAVPLLIRGETGTGKGVLARWLHANGPRRDEAFVDLNCAGLSRELLETELFGHEKGAFTGAVAAKQGLMEMAHRGTVFLDEIGEVDPAVQPKLLKVVEELRFRRLGDVRDRQVDVRLIAATHRDLARLVEEQKFREDLYYRINAFPLVVPPLRERGDDVVLLARSLLQRIGGDLGRPGRQLSDAAEKTLLSQPWPGNVRQLRNVLEHAVLLGARAVIEVEDLGLDTTVPSPDPSPEAAPPERLSLAEAERRHIEGVLRLEGWVVPRAATVLGLSRTALYDRIRKHGIVLPSSR